ncbi:MAG: preprotein translocase subunit SecA [Lentisphaerae bacterium]|nr:preprotein translocase subunit SecA [Lentisphaerota bacterium]
MRILEKLFGSKHQRDLRKLRPLVERINQVEQDYQALTEEQLRAKTAEFKARLAKGETLDDLLCEAFAVVKNACRRLVGTSVDVCGHVLTWDMVPFDVQLVGGIVLHQGKIAEMATGEGKTLVATMPLYLNALAGSVHLVTTNDYLARRDSQWMGHVFKYLGVTVGCIQNQMNNAERREHYACDITYGTNSEFGFDYLRDNGMAFEPESQVQRGHQFAIIDEIDSILIDEARTPLIISGPAPVSTHQFFELKPRVETLVRKQRALCSQYMQEAKEQLDKGEDGDKSLIQQRLYQVFHGMPKHKQWMHLLEDTAVRRLHEQIENSMLTEMRKEEGRVWREDLYFTIDERGHEATLTEKGCEALNPGDPDAFLLPDLVTMMADVDADKAVAEPDKARRRQEIQTQFAEKSERIHNVDQLIRAYCLYERDVDYVVQDNQVMIVDEFTGRMLPGRRWSDGLHQAVEAKEGVKIERETQTLATITIQNYFRLYAKLAGMTGTAETEANEFHSIYKLDVVVIPTNRPVRRLDGNDVIYKTEREKYKALVDEITECHRRGQPVLVGTVSVDTSEVISRYLKRAAIPHNVLNAKQHEREAEIVARAGQAGAVTIATNMAGRGTDIKLGEGVVKVERSVITSGTALDDRLGEGKTLREILLAEPCGLHVIGSERHESRRIDRQLRGRCARQGDPGSSRFYISLEDDLMRLFGSDRIAGIMSRLGLEEGQQLEHRWLNRSIETAQRRVEQQNFSIRKRTLEYDDVMNKQREVIYGFRGDIVRSKNVREHVYDILEELIADRAEQWLGGDDSEGVTAYLEWIRSTFPIPVREDDLRPLVGQAAEAAAMIFKRVQESYELKVTLEDPVMLMTMERHVMLSAIDNHWQEYLRAMDALRQGVGLRAYGQRDPLVEYKREAYEMFEELMGHIKQEIASAIFRSSTSLKSLEAFMTSLPRTMAVHEGVSLLGKRAAPAPEAAPARPARPVIDVEAMLAPPPAAAPTGDPMRREEPKVGRNDLCPCGSGKKFKKCHGV